MIPFFFIQPGRVSVNKYVLIFLSGTLVTAIGSFANEEKPRVSFIQKNSDILENPVQQAIQETRKKLSELAHADAVVMKNFDSLAEVLSIAFQKEKSMTVQEIQKVCSGIDFAAEKHRFQTRKNKEKTPYVSHPIGVTYHLMVVGEIREVSVIIGALLHDVMEETQTTFEEIENKFGRAVASLVREVTDDKSIAREARKRLQVINASHQSKEAAQINLADKLFNLSDLYNNPPSDWTQTRIDRYYEWAQSVINRLPNANNQLLNAAEEIINQYWEKQVPVSSSD
jgi:(p)ppGpp synthase/HD superfamily hydrolase